MPSKVEPTEQVLSDVTQRLEALNRSQTSLDSVASSRSMPVIDPSNSRRTKHSCNLCMKQCSSSTQLHFHRPTHIMEDMAMRLKSNKVPNSPETIKAQRYVCERDPEVLSLNPPEPKGRRLEVFFNGGKLKIKRGKAHVTPKANISTFFAERKTSQRSASSGDSGYESMERPDPVASLLGMKAKEAKRQEPEQDLRKPQAPVVVKANLPKRSKDQNVDVVATSAAYISRRRNDEISKFKRFSRQLDQTPLLKQATRIPEDRVAEGDDFIANKYQNKAEAATSSHHERKQPGKSIQPPGIATMASAMSSTDDILGELVSPTSYRSRMESSRQSGASMSDGELSFMGIRAPSLYSLNICDTDNDNLAERLAHNVIKRCLNLQSQHTIRSRTTSRQGSNQSTPPTSARHTPATSVSSNSKRSRSKDDSTESPDDDEDTKRRFSDTKRTRLETQPDLKLFACPYSKHDPHRFSELNMHEKEYRRCACCYLRDIPRLKQHLYRVHRRPEYYCGSCYDSFKTRDQLDAHARQRPSCELRVPKYEEKMTDDQLNSIKRRIVKGDPCELWFNIYKTLFPAAPRPLSPYASDNDPMLVTHFVNLFRWFGPEELFNLMRDRREQMAEEGGLQQPLETATQVIVDEAFEIALPAYLQAQVDGSLRAPLPTFVGELAAGSYVEMGSSGTHNSFRQQYQQPPTSAATSGPRPATTIIIPTPLNSHDDLDPFCPPLHHTPYPTTTQHPTPAPDWTLEPPAFDPTEVLSAFDSYNSVISSSPQHRHQHETHLHPSSPPSTLPLRNMLPNTSNEIAVDDFFDFASYRS